MDIDIDQLFKPLLNEMGAKRSIWFPLSQLKAREEVHKRLLQGVEMSNPWEQLHFTPEGFLTHEEEQIVLYIKDTQLEKVMLLNSPEDTRRFHIRNCKTLQQMFIDNRIDRYVATNRSDGKFSVDAADSKQSIDATLFICKNCLIELNWKGYVDLGKPANIWKGFCLREFFAEYSTFFVNMPKYTEHTSPRSGYTKDWPRISRQYKEQRGWRCEQCEVELSDSRHRSLLHVHHMNGRSEDNNHSNLRALCRLCHSKQPLHQRCRPPIEEQKLIENLRQQQSV